MIKQKKNIAIIAVVGAVIVASTGVFAVAQSNNDNNSVVQKIGFGGKDRRGGKRHAMKALFKNADLNKDGSLTQEELDTYRTQQVTNADANGDGNISLAEFETIWMAQTKNRMIRAFQRLDSDADGSITKAEQDEPFANLVERLDRNGDGVLNREDRRKWGKKREHNKPDNG